MSVGIKNNNELKVRYINEGKNLAKSVALACQMIEAEAFYCPRFKSSNGCYCLQNYISVNDSSLMIQRVKFLVDCTRKAQYLRTKKKVQTKNSERVLANKRRCPEYEEFVLKRRNHFKNNFKLCEEACKKLLLYSNKFLFNKLKSNPDNSARVLRKNNKISLNRKSITLDDIPKLNCCAKKCTKSVKLDDILLWRERSSNGWAEAKKVIIENFIDSTGKIIHCHLFIQIITGACFNTVKSISKNLKKLKKDCPVNKEINFNLKGVNFEASDEEKKIKEISLDHCIPEINRDNFQEFFHDNLNKEVRGHNCFDLVKSYANIDIGKMSTNNAISALMNRREKIEEIQSFLENQKHIIDQEIKRLENLPLGLDRIDSMEGAISTECDLGESYLEKNDVAKKAPENSILLLPDEPPKLFDGANREFLLESDKSNSIDQAKFSASEFNKLRTNDLLKSLELPRSLSDLFEGDIISRRASCFGSVQHSAQTSPVSNSAFNFDFFNQHQMQNDNQQSNFGNQVNTGANDQSYNIKTSSDKFAREDENSDSSRKKAGNQLRNDLKMSFEECEANSNMETVIVGDSQDVQIVQI